MRGPSTVASGGRIAVGAVGCRLHVKIVGATVGTTVGVTNAPTVAPTITWCPTAPSTLLSARQ